MATGVARTHGIYPVVESISVDSGRRATANGLWMVGQVE